jgi:hypothetical protein
MSRVRHQSGGAANRPAARAHDNSPFSTPRPAVWDYEKDELLYDAQLGGADEAALQEAALRQRADGGAASAGLSAATAAMQEASLAAKGTASGLVRDIQFFDMDTCFWQIARQHWMQYGATDDRTIPYLGARRR